uniref:uncharacterized protein LOC122587215 isoform X2 n=1 Tax=Erigeron canadensis TaxID=72917 RepID=UPI001CB95F6C|nr:uncharacterized protein LOC122587215 isoform X2 [Erigeron canadensis]
MEDMLQGVNEVEQQLKEAGKQLAAFPSSSSNFTTKNLLDLLDKIELLLTFVRQAPSISMQGALVPSMGALIGDELLKHMDVNVRVLVASCLCEVTRITAPEPPYKDDIMKEIFQLYVMAFGELSNVTGDSYYKAIHILESVAKVKSCLLMLDLECDALVLEMFRQFLSHIRLNHPHNVFSDMETIMTLIIEESDEVATELLSLLLFHVKKEKQNLSPASWKLAEKVLRNCNGTLQLYSETLLKLINSDPDDYAEVVTLLCQNVNGDESVVTKSAKAKNIHSRDRNNFVNGGSTKKRKTDTQKQLKGKELETPKRGRPINKKNYLNQDSSPSLVQNSQEDARRTRFQGKSKVNQEYDNLSDYDGEELLSQQTNKVQSRSKPSSKKRIANDFHGKENVKKWGQDLVGHNIKVWWPLDKMFYKGVISSYDPIVDKYKVLYADGDEEVLDLYHEKWTMLDEASPDRRLEKVLALPSPVAVTIPARKLTRKGKKKLESSPMPEENSNAPKSPAPADSTKAEPTRELEIASANTSNTNIPSVLDSQMEDLVQTSDISSELKVTEKAPADSTKTETTKEHEIAGANTSNTNISSTVDYQMDDLVQTSGISSEVQLTEKTKTDMVEQEGEPNLSGELEEKSVPGPSETAQIGEKDEDLACAIPDHHTA